jgi:hypothetical protein
MLKEITLKLTNIKKLRKLKLSRIDLNDNLIVKNICDIIENAQNIYLLDISWASLKP